MKRVIYTALFAGTLCGAWLIRQSADACGNPSLWTWARQAVAEDSSTAEAAIQQLRAAGPDGLRALLLTHADVIAQHQKMLTAQRAAEASSLISPTSPSIDNADADAAWQRLRWALDEVSGQRDCHAARLFWYTDLEQAQAAAKAQGKPILSLRLLGKLTDEFSCANSRFFRTTLYANDEVGKMLRDRFILHWKSVRPVPRVTIDFGDGRKLERTLTGNSIHYILDSDGQVIDALPGLYGPQAFLRELSRAEQATKEASKKSGADRDAYLVEYHRQRAEAIQRAWQADVEKVTVATKTAVERTASKRSSGSFPTAAEAARSAEAKGAVEKPLIQASLATADDLALASTEAVWNQIAALHADDAALDAASLALIRSHKPTAAAAAPLAISKMIVEDPLVRMVRNFQGSIALDTVRNEYLFHRQIHAWLAEGAYGNLDLLNERVYAQLFLTPSSDPWLGLMPDGAYTGLDRNGVAQSTVP